MQAMQTLLSHRYLILNRIAIQLYGQDSGAAKQRLRGRVRGQLRFTEAEYLQLVQFVGQCARRMDDINKELQKPPKRGAALPIELLKEPWLNTKALITDAGNDAGLPDPYYTLYDRLRLRQAESPELLSALARRANTFAQWLRGELEMAREEAKTYEWGKGLV